MSYAKERAAEFRQMRLWTGAIMKLEDWQRRADVMNSLHGRQCDDCGEWVPLGDYSDHRATECNPPPKPDSEPVPLMDPRTPGAILKGLLFLLIAAAVCALMSGGGTP